MENRPDRLRRAVPRLAALLFLLLWAHQTDKPLQLDDVDHFGIAEAIVETGRPVYYRGEGNTALSGALHPPLNDHLLAGWFLLFGVGVVQARSFALLCTFLHGGAVLLLARCLCPRPVAERLAPWFWPLFLLNPYTLQMASMVDIDSSTYGPVLVLLLWSVVRLSWRRGERRRDPPRLREFALVALLLAVCLWIKLTTVLLAVPFLFLLLALRMKPVRALVLATLTTGLGLALFLGSFWLACRAWGLDPLETIRFVRANAGRGGFAGGDTLAYMTLHLARWTGFLPWLVLGAVVLTLAWSALRRRRDVGPPAPETLLLLTLAATSTLYYLATRMTFGNAPYKYAFVYFGLALLPLALLASRGEGGAAERRRWPLYGPVLAFGLWLGLGVLGDSVVQHGWSRATLLALGVPAAAAALAYLADGVRDWRTPRSSLVLLRLALFLHLGAQLGGAVHQSRIESSTTYDYGQRGLAATASFLRSRTTPGDVISSMKDVGFLARRRYIESYSGLYGGEAEARRLIEAWESGRVRFIVFTEAIGQDQLVVQPLLREWIARNARLVASIGNYRVYEPRAAAQRAPARRAA